MMSQDKIERVLEDITADAMRAAKLRGIRIAVCVVAIDDEYARAYVSPFQAETLEGIAVAQQLRAQSRVLWQQARDTA